MTWMIAPWGTPPAGMEVHNGRFFKTWPDPWKVHKQSYTDDVQLEMDGSTFILRPMAIPSDGFYTMAYDLLTDRYVFDKVQAIGITTVEVLNTGQGRGFSSYHAAYVMQEERHLTVKEYYRAYGARHTRYAQNLPT